MRHPLNSFRLTDPFGPRGAVPGVPGTGSFHTGQDYAAPKGTPILAAHSGVITRKWFDRFANGNGAGGNMVEIRGDDGYVTRYAHMEEQSPLKVGQWVAEGQQIGQVGMTGAANGYHLHFEVLKNGKFIDPLTVIDVTKPKKVRNKKMLGLTINDGQGRYGPKGQQYWATYDGTQFIELAKEDANAASVSLGTSFGNFTYAGWEAYKNAAKKGPSVNVTIDGEVGNVQIDPEDMRKIIDAINADRIVTTKAQA